MNHREGFKKAIVENMCDSVTRLVYADWLEENGLDDEAREQRRMSSAEWVAAVEWMHVFAEKGGYNCYYGDETPDSKITYQIVMDAARTWVETAIEESYESDGKKHSWISGDYFTQHGQEGLRDLMSSQKQQDEFWKNYQIIVGQTVEKNKQGTVFSCFC